MLVEFTTCYANSIVPTANYFDNTLLKILSQHLHSQEHGLKRYSGDI